jgi:hypothetical protein
VVEEKEVRTGVVLEKEECSYDRGSGERANRKIQSIQAEAGEVACGDGMCYCPVFLETKLIQPLVALPPTNPLTSLLADNLIGRGEVAPVENA